VSATVVVVTSIRAPAAMVFDLELNAEVHAASLESSGEQASTSTGRPGLALGDEVTFTARHLGRTWRLTSRVTEYDRPHRFVDEQVRGPFRAMRHEHTFDAADDGTTRMTDRMTFEVPLGPVGAVVARLVLVPYLCRLLELRAAHIRDLAET
jgi:ligand-binding SRPBCC domain-containing protein